MLQTWIEHWRMQPLPVAFLVAFGIQMAMYLGAAGEIAGVYALLRRRFGIGALIDTRPLAPRQLRDEIRRSLRACTIHAIPTVLFLHYSDTIWPASWREAAWQVAGFLLLNDFCAYWTHRLLHTPALLKHHSAHHRSRRVTPWSALSMHPVEALLAQLPYVIFLGVLWSAGLPMGIGTLLGLQLILMVGQANSHSNYDPLAQYNGWPLLKRQTLFHQHHHRHGRDNYGYMGPHWDHVFHTAAQPDGETQPRA